MGKLLACLNFLGTGKSLRYIPRRLAELTLVSCIWSPRHLMAFLGHNP